MSGEKHTNCIVQWLFKILVYSMWTDLSMILAYAVHMQLIQSSEHWILDRMIANMHILEWLKVVYEQNRSVAIEFFYSWFCRLGGCTTQAYFVEQVLKWARIAFFTLKIYNLVLSLWLWKGKMICFIPHIS